jgi:pyruvate dehydrogenase E2 component (dihydrolipoamide acetyltransferase)
MAKEFKLPDLGEGIHEGEVLDVKVKSGQQVKEDQTILEVETDKAAVEIPSPYTDVVTEIRVAPGDIVHVGDVMMTFGGTADNVAEEEREQPRAEEAEEEERERAAAPEGGRQREFRSGREPGAEGELQVAEDTGAGPEAAPGPGEEGETVPEREGERALADRRAPAAEREREPRGEPHREGPVPAAPSTRRLARELGVDLHAVRPSGPGGRVLAEDVRAYAEGGDGREEAEPVPEREEERPRAGRHIRAEARPKFAGISPQTVEVPGLPDFEHMGPVERLPLRSVRRATAKQMALAWSQIPHVATQDLVDITELEKLRERYKEQIRESGGALTATVFVMKALVNALKEFPRFNATLDIEAEEIILKKFYNVGIAVDTERGLLVPTIRDVDRKSIAELAVDLKTMAERAREGQASLEDMQGSTITITNIGALGGTAFAPIINFPQVAILGMARATVQPVAKTVDFPEGQEPKAWEDRYEFVPRLMLPLIISFDHRVNDGAEAQRFMNRIIEQLENPERLLLGL